MATTRFGTFDELMADTAAGLQPVARRLREIILEVHPEAVEVVRLGDRAATYGVGPRKMSEAYAYILPYAGYVNLGFFYGSDLEDPDGLLAGNGARMRHARIATMEDADAPAVRLLIEAALRERRAALGPEDGEGAA